MPRCENFVAIRSAFPPRTGTILSGQGARSMAPGGGRLDGEAMEAPGPNPIATEAVVARGVGARLRDWTAIFVMLSSAPAMALSFTAIAPVLQLIAAHFGPGGQPALTIPLAGIAIDGPLFAQLISTLPSVGLFLGGPPI